MTCFNTSKYAPEDRREYIDSLYREYKGACKNGNKEMKMEIKQKLTEEGVNSYDYYSISSFVAFILGIAAIVAVVAFVIIF